MLKILNQSLFLRLAVSMVLIISLAFSGMLSTVIVAESSEGQAAAINLAGSLRMQAYRLSSALGEAVQTSADQQSRLLELSAAFSQRLRDPRLTGVLLKIRSADVNRAYHQVEEQWQGEFQPMLRQYIEALTDHSSEANTLRWRFSEHTPLLVTHIDAMVRALEFSAEANIQRIRLIQVSTLFLTLLVAFVTLYWMHNRVLAPLRDLSQCARAVRDGDFSAQTRYQGADELGQLSIAFNTMAAELSRMYRDLEARVRRKTADLERSNRSLDLLYRTTRRLSEAPLTDAVYRDLLQDIQDTIGTGPGEICLGEDGKSHAFRLASNRSAPLPASDICRRPDCQACFTGAATHTVIRVPQSPAATPMLSIPIKDMEKQYGVLLLETGTEGNLQPWQQILLETIASHIALALKMAQRGSQVRMLALLEERSTIARELHDSLAQSLSYLKIQVSRLDAELGHDQQSASRIKGITGELRDGLNNAYRQLRELLTTFRLRIDEANFNNTMQNIVREYQQRGSVRIILENHLGNCKLPPNAEINVIQVIREALANVLQHARAKQAAVALHCDIHGGVNISIDDDGVGLQQPEALPHHYGLTIMRERAHAIGGELQILASPLGGTRVLLHFRTDMQEIYQQAITS